MSTLAEVNASIASYQAARAAGDVQRDAYAVSSATLVAAIESGQASIDAATAARDSAVSAAQANFDAALLVLEEAISTETTAFGATLATVLAYVPDP